ncbi:TetR/AcrR family transcriptional regulator [Mycolicibacterium sp.]|uniref:TetR/AcrR family transcriptional regulator n=1 Tax=Mycolicibacterium sp. TaxID=2320850 RepID=UPI003D0CECCE
MNGTRRDRRRDQVTSELLDRATKLFADKGYDSTTVGDIAEAAGMSRSSLYHYIRNKDDLLTLLVQQVSNALAEILGELAERSDLTPTAKLRALTGLLVVHRARHPDQFRILDRSEALLPKPARTEHDRAKRRVLHELTRIIDDGVAAGEFHVPDSRTAALSLLGMCNWVAWWFRPGTDIDATVAALTSYAEAMVSARRPPTAAQGAPGLIDEIRFRLDRLESLHDNTTH